MSNRDLIDELEAKVFERRPILFDILQKYGSMSLYDYSKRYYREPDYPIDEKRKKEFLEGFSQEIESIFGKDIADSCAKQMAKSYHLANTEHHGPAGTSRQLNNGLITALPFLENPIGDFQNNIIVACSNISFNNWTFPRGFKFSTYSNKGLSEIELTFFGHTVDSYPVINHKAFNADSIKNMRKSLYTMWNERFVWKKEFRKLNELIDEIFSDKDVLNQTIFTNQSSLINFKFWNKISEILQKPLQKLIYIEQEKLTNRLISQYHIKQDTTIHKILFDPKYHDLMTKYFEGILCGFSEKTQYGTFLFWALPEGKKYRTQLWRRGNKLVSPDGSYEIELSPESVEKAISKGELIPSTLLCFIIFCFYYGIRQIGGPNQTTFLTQMKEAYLKMQEEAQDTESIRLCKDIPTTDIIPGNPPVLAFLKGPKGELIPATPLDLYLYGTPSTVETIINVSKEVTLGDSIKRTMHLWYKRCYIEEERDAKLSTVTEKMIDEVIGLDKKLKPFTIVGDKTILA